MTWIILGIAFLFICLAVAAKRADKDIDEILKEYSDNRKEIL